MLVSTWPSAAAESYYWRILHIIITLLVRIESKIVHFFFSFFLFPLRRWRFMGRCARTAMRYTWLARTCVVTRNNSKNNNWNRPIYVTNVDVLSLKKNTSCVKCRQNNNAISSRTGCYRRTYFRFWGGRRKVDVAGIYMIYIYIYTSDADALYTGRSFCVW